MAEVGCGQGSQWVHSYAMLVTNFGGIMAIPTDPSYCLVYPTIYSNDVAHKNQNHFNTTAAPPPQGCIPMAAYAVLCSSMQT